MFSFMLFIEPGAKHTQKMGSSCFAAGVVVKACKSFLPRVSYLQGFHILHASSMRFTTDLTFAFFFCYCFFFFVFFFCSPPIQEPEPKWLTTSGATQTHPWGIQLDTRPVSDSPLGNCVRNALR